MDTRVLLGMETCGTWLRRKTGHGMDAGKKKYLAYVSRDQNWVESVSVYVRFKKKLREENWVESVSLYVRFKKKLMIMVPQ